jgi:hypothetical protein
MNSTLEGNSQNIDSNSHFLAIQAVLQAVIIELATTITETIAAIHTIQLIAARSAVFSQFMSLLSFISV